VNSTASVEGDERIRLFCALTLPEQTIERVVEWQRELPPGDYRVVPPENLHLTLAFLGHRPAHELGAIESELEQAAHAAEPVVLRLSRYGETRSVGMLVFDDEVPAGRSRGAAASLAADLHARLERLGVYDPERRRWLPHLTVVRFRKRPWLAPWLPDLGTIVPSEAAVYHSLLRPTGAQYVVLHSASLCQLKTSN
jgi:RNA 2',3'-cyclic 3'-phosphodiesterase